MTTGRIRSATVHLRDFATWELGVADQRYDGIIEPTAWITALMAQTSFRNAVQNIDSGSKSLKHGSINALTVEMQLTR